MILSLMDDSMNDNITIMRSWQDIDFFEIDIECKTRLITVREKIYTTDDLIDDLYKKIEMFLSKDDKPICWSNGTKGNDSTPCVIFRFSRKDRLGHVLIEVFMEIDDGGSLDFHHCCFYVNTEIGLLYQFKNSLPNLKIPELGIRVELNHTEN